MFYILKIFFLWLMIFLVRGRRDTCPCVREMILVTTTPAIPSRGIGCLMFLACSLIYLERPQAMPYVASEVQPLSWTVLLWEVFGINLGVGGGVG